MTEHSGDKYRRQIRSSRDSTNSITVDVYDVLVAFNVSNPAIAHSVKKLLCCGIRGKGSPVQDLTEARDAISRAIELAKFPCLESDLKTTPVD